MMLHFISNDNSSPLFWKDSQTAAQVLNDFIISCYTVEAVSFILNEQLRINRLGKTSRVCIERDDKFM